MILLMQQNSRATQVNYFISIQVSRELTGSWPTWPVKVSGANYIRNAMTKKKKKRSECSDFVYLICGQV